MKNLTGSSQLRPVLLFDFKRFTAPHLDSPSGWAEGEALQEACMRKFLVAIALLFSCYDASLATAITVHYTGTYTGTWTGGYDPTMSSTPCPFNGPCSGAIGLTPFDLTFEFNTDLAQPGNFDSSHLISPFTGLILIPSVGHATFVSPQFFNSNTVAGNTFNIGNQTASDEAGVGFTRQTAQSEFLNRFGRQRLAVSISASSPDIPPFILANYTITNGLTGSGSLTFDYANFSFVGGVGRLFLTPLTLEVSVFPMTAAVPEPSTWVMLLLGFAFIGFTANHRKIPPGLNGLAKSAPETAAKLSWWVFKAAPKAEPRSSGFALA
jgi:hypothetical protein